VRDWMRKHSTVWNRYDPRPDPHLICPGCGGKAPPETLGEATHSIGRVNYSDKGEHVLHCDGSEAKA